MWYKLFKPVLTKPRLTLGLVGILTVIFAAGIPRLEVRNNFDGELPSDDPIVEGVNEVEDIFEERSTILIGIKNESGIYNTSTLTKVAEISEALKEVPFVIIDEINSLSTLNNIKTRSWGLDVGVFMKDIPEEDFSMIQLQKDVAENELVLGKFVSENGKMTVIAANLEDGFSGGEVYDSIEQLIEPFQGPEEIYLSGPPLMVEDVQRGISADSGLFVPIALVIIFIGFFLCFRTLRGTLLPILVVILSIVWTMGFMGYLDLPITVVSNALPVVMVAVASSYGIHVMYTYYEKANQLESRKDIVSQTLEKIAKPILITGFTSAVGSVSLLVFNIISLREFGVIGAAGFIFATFLCLTVLPALLSILPVSRGKLYKTRFLTNALNRLTNWSYNNRRLVLGIFLVLVPLFVWFSMQIKIGDNYVKFFPKKHKGRLASEAFNDNMSGIRFLDIVVDGLEYDQIKDSTFYAKIGAFQQEVENLPHVGSSYAYTDIIRQTRNAMLADEQRQANPSNTEISQFLMMYEMSADPGDVFSVRDEDYQRIKMQVFLKTSEPAEHEEIYEAVSNIFSKYFDDDEATITFGGEVMYRIALGRYIVKGKIQNILLAVLSVFVICSFLFRSVKKGLFTILPVCLSLLAVFGLMGVFGIRLGISTSLLTAMIVGIGVDFAVHYLMRFYREKEAEDTYGAILNTSSSTGSAILFDSLSNTLGFAVVMLSGFLPVQHFGLLLSMSMLLIFLITVIVFPCLFSLLDNSKVNTLKPSIAS